MTAFQPDVFQHDGFQVDPVTGIITQTLGPMSCVFVGMVPTEGAIAQVLGALEQSVDVTVHIIDVPGFKWGSGWPIPVIFEPLKKKKKPPVVIVFSETGEDLHTRDDEELLVLL